VNALAGGGTLISFPTLTAVGVPIVSANVTSTVALCPGYLGGAFAQRDSVRRQRARLRVLAPAGILGGLTGGILLLATGDALLRQLVPFLILIACALLAAQEHIRTMVEARRRRRREVDVRSRELPAHGVSVAAVAAVFGASVYGGYFGGALGIVFLGVLGVFLVDDLREVNALKQSMSLIVNVTAALFFLTSGRVWWVAAAFLAVGSLLGGNLGGRLIGRIDPGLLRWVVVTIGVVVAVVYLVR
jgi:uncharacterized protein